MKTLVIGRSAYADIVLADVSIAPHHAELVITDDGRFFLTDCASETGTWRRKGEGEGAAGWAPVRQAFVAGDEPLRLGDHPCTAAELAGARRHDGAGDAAGHLDRDGPGPAGSREAARGRVERNPVTGEIVRRRR